MKLSSLAVGSFLTLLGSTAYADIPAGYLGKPFDPAIAGGVALPSTVKAGPYPIPGRLDFVNYDMGGINVGYFTGDHVGCGGDGYRTDGVTPTLCKTNAKEGDVWYDTGNPAIDGTQYPSTTTADFYIGAAHPNDYVNITVNVRTAGTYALSSTWASGNGPLGGEGGNGAMELQVYINGAKPPAVDWKSTFPNYQTTANYHKWKSFPSFATITLEAGVQVIKLELQAFHLNLSYVQFSLMLPGGGLDDGGSAAGGAGGASAGGAGAGGGATTAGAGGDTSATSGAGGSSGASVDQAGTSAIAGSATTGGATNSEAGTSASAGSLSATTGGAATAGSSPSNNATPSSDKSGCSCTIAMPRDRQSTTAMAWALGLVGVLVVRSRQRARAFRSARVG